VNGRVEVDLCGAVEAGAVTGRKGSGVDAERAANVCLAGVERRARGVPARRANVRLTLGVDLLVVAVRPHFSVSEAGRSAVVRRSAGRALLGVELRLP
jgi:hypothetical protein